MLGLRRKIRALKISEWVSFHGEAFRQNNVSNWKISYKGVKSTESASGPNFLKNRVLELFLHIAVIRLKKA